ncbi:MAG: type II secretion system F family protein [Pseudohongiella sp.]|nr:type II secretion system F family protein [Pseudohongiella sp.]
MTGISSRNYSWKGKDLSGQAQQGISSASSPELLRRELYVKGILVTHCKVSKMPAQKIKPLRLQPGMLTLFLRQSAAMLQAGLPLVQALEISIDCMPASRFKDEISYIKQQVAQGSLLGEAISLSALGKQSLLVNMIKAAEQSGTLDITMQSLADDHQKAERLRARVKKALFYPLMVLLVALLVTTLLLVKVVPQFESTFAELGAELPALTLTVMALSDLAIVYAPVAGVVLVVAILVLRTLISRSNTLQLLVDKMILVLPLCGSIVQNACLCRFSQTLSGSLRAGLPLMQALESTAAATGNRVFESACITIRHLINEGQPLSYAVRKNNLFPVMIAQLVYAGEQSGTLDQMLQTCADRYEQRVDQAVDTLSSMIEPLVMIVLGTIVAVLMLAMYLPVFRLGAVL